MYLGLWVCFSPSSPYQSWPLSFSSSRTGLVPSERVETTVWQKVKGPGLDGGWRWAQSWVKANVRTRLEWSSLYRKQGSSPRAEPTQA